MAGRYTPTSLTVAALGHNRLMSTAATRPVVDLELLDEPQREAAQAPLGPLAIIAGPGSGKTRTVVARIASLCAQGVDPTKVLALTHTQKAAGELRERLQEHGLSEVNCSTFHSAAWRVVRDNWQATGITGEAELIGSTWALMRQAAKRALGATGEQYVPDLVSEIDWARAWRLQPDEYPSHAKQHGRSCAVEPKDVVKTWKAFEKAKAPNQLDFADVIRLSEQVMQDPETARGVRQRWEVFFVDEYQDADRAQQAALEAWLGDRQSLTVCGDPEQSIFGFKGADPQLLLGFQEKWPNARVIHLVRNYRSTPGIVSWVNLATRTARPALVSANSQGVDPMILAAGSEAEEERRLVHQLKEWQRSGTPYEEMAVLYRFNATSARLEAALAQAGVPYHVAGNQKFFDRPEIRSVLIPFGVQARSQPETQGALLLEAAARQGGWDPQSPPEGAGPARQRFEAISSLVAMAQSPSAPHDAMGLLRELQHRARQAHDLTPGGVTLATVHAAKGLEWDCVWVPGVVEGQLPSAYATSGPQLAEEQHLFYVAISRARRALVVSWAQKRHNNWSNNPSRFLDLVSTPEPRSVGSNKRPRSSSAASAVPDFDLAGCSRCGTRLLGQAARVSKVCSSACLTGESLARYQRLVAWRAERSESLGRSQDKVASEKALFSAAVLGLEAGHDPTSAKGIAGFAKDCGPLPR